MICAYGHHKNANDIRVPCHIEKSAHELVGLKFSSYGKKACAKLIMYIGLKEQFCLNASSSRVTNY